MSTLRELWHHKVAVVLVVVVAAFAAILSAYRLPSLEKRSVELGSASSQILVDSPRSTLVGGASSAALSTLSTRARVYAQYLSSRDARERISAASGIPEGAIASNGPFSADTKRMNYEPQPAEARANDILKERGSYRLVFIAQQDVPIITVSALAPSAREAIRLADASVIALKEYVASLTRGRGEVVVRELGAAEGGTIGGGNSMLLMAFVFFAVLGLGCLLIAVMPGIARHWRQLDWTERMAKEWRPDDADSADVANEAGMAASPRRGRRGRRRARADRDREATEDVEQRTPSTVP